MGQECKQSAPRAIIVTPNAAAAASSCPSYASPHWPQSYGPTMEVLSRSTSTSRLWSWSMPAENDLETSLSDQLDDTDLRAPLLLQDSGHLDFENACVQKGDHNDSSNLLLTKKFEDEEEPLVHGSTFLQSLFNGMNVLAGVGILSAPYAAAKGGWLGLTLLFYFAIVMCYTGVLLSRCLHSNPFIRSFPDIGEASFGKYGRWVVAILLYLELYAVSIDILILEGDNLAQLFPNVSLTMGSRFFGPQEVFTVCAAVCMLPTVWLRELRFLSYVSAGGVFASLWLVLAVGWVGVVDGVGFHHPGSIVHLQGLPVAIGLFSFCYNGHTVFPSIYSSMHDRKQFSSVLIICFVLCTFMYGGIAIMGYTMFGDELQSQITLNLPSDLPTSTVTIWIMLMSPFTKYALTLMPLAVALEEFLPTTSRNKMVLGGTIMRTCLVASTVLVALTVPFFGLLMAFIGSFLSVAVTVLVPCICYLKLYRMRLSIAEVSLIVFIICLGFLAGGVGTYYSVKEILEQST